MALKVRRPTSSRKKTQTQQLADLRRDVYRLKSEVEIKRIVTGTVNLQLGQFINTDTYRALVNLVDIVQGVKGFERTGNEVRVQHVKITCALTTKITSRSSNMIRLCLVKDKQNNDTQVPYSGQTGVYNTSVNAVPPPEAISEFLNRKRFQILRERTITLVPKVPGDFDTITSMVSQYIPVTKVFEWNIPMDLLLQYLPNGVHPITNNLLFMAIQRQPTGAGDTNTVYMSMMGTVQFTDA